MISQELLQTYKRVHPQYHKFQLVVVGLNDGDEKFAWYLRYNTGLIRYITYVSFNYWVGGGGYDIP